MLNNVKFIKSKRVFPIITAVIGIAAAIILQILRLNIVAAASVLYMCILSAIIFIGLIAKKKLYLWNFVGYFASALGVITYYTIWGADAGFGAFTSGKAGFASAAHPLLQGSGNFLTRLCGNVLLSLPCIIIAVLLIVLSTRKIRKAKLHLTLTAILSVILSGVSVFYFLTMNLRSEPNSERMWEGEKDYLDNVNKSAKSSPNVLFILMDDLGWGDISLNGAIYDTPNIDSIGENGVSFDNFYSSYSVCSPARFACMTGRYPYRGYADNVMYPTVDTLSPFAQTRIFNSVEMGANCDGMLGDEITIAEVFKAAGYDTGAFGKWHLGDYGEYLPTNQGFDYFYGSHYVNDMTPFYHVSEKDGQYTIAHGTDEFMKDGKKDQSKATEWINEEMFKWLDEQKNSDNPFFLFYASPWPHAPVFVGDDFKGESGMGTYVDCITEVDSYLGLLFDKLEKMGELDNTIIVFTSDNGPALEGSTGELRGGKYLAYEGGQKVPCMIRWDNNNGLWNNGDVRTQSATLVDFFPTLIDLCAVSGGNGEGTYLPSDRTIDGVSMLPLIKNDSVIHTKEHPILHMKREKIKAIQYTVPTSDILSREEYKDYTYPVLTDNEYITFKYFKNIQNDNSAFFDKFRKNWLHILNDDAGENYNRTPTYPTVSDEMKDKTDEIMKDFKENRRGINRDYYKK